MLEDRDKIAFWKVVKACLVELYHLSERKANKEVKKLRGEIEKPPVGMSSVMIYHAEPFDVAYDIVQYRMDRSSYDENKEPGLDNLACRKEYDKILESHKFLGKLH